MVDVCAICDIAGCHHIRAKEGAKKMPLSAGMGQPLPTPDFKFMTDQQAAARLRDRVAREIAAEVAKGDVDNILLKGDLLPVFRWLEEITQKEQSDG